MEKVHEYRERASAGENLPPVHVYFDGATYRLFDGFHRIAALQELGIEKVDTEVTLGTLADMKRLWQEALQQALSHLRQAKL